jgi:hypothetical protein
LDRLSRSQFDTLYLIEKVTSIIIQLWKYILSSATTSLAEYAYYASKHQLNQIVS